MGHGMFGIPIRRMVVRNVHSGLITDLPSDPGPALLQRNFKLVFVYLVEIRRIVVDDIDVVQWRARRLLM